MIRPANIALSIKLGLLLFSACLLSASSAWADDSFDVCSRYKVSTDITIKFLLQQTLVDDGQTTAMGKFSIENHGSKPIIIEGRDMHGYFYIFASAVIQYRGTDGIWLEPEITPAESTAPVRQLELKPNSSGVFYAFAPQYQGEKSVDQARMILIGDPRGLCVYSKPFASVNAKP